MDASFQRHPEALSALRLERSGSPVAHQHGVVVRPTPELIALLPLFFRYIPREHQGVVEFVGTPHLGPGVASDGFDGIGVQASQVARDRGVEPAAVPDGVGPPLLEGRVVQEGIGPGVEDLLGHGRGLAEVPGVHVHVAGLHHLQNRLQRRDVHGLVQAVPDGLGDQGMVRHLPVARDVLQARDLVGEHLGDEVLGDRPLYLRRHSVPAPAPQHGQGDRRVPAPAHLEHGRVEEGLDQDLPDGLCVEIAEDVVEGETVCGAQGQDDGILVRRSLQLEVEGPAETLAQGQSPGPVDAASEGTVEHEVHIAGLVEEPFRHQVLLGRDHAEGRLGRAKVLRDLRRRHVGDARGLHQPVLGLPLPFGVKFPLAGGPFLRACPVVASIRVFRAVAIRRSAVPCAEVDPTRYLFPQPRQGGGKLRRPSRRLSEPEGHRRRHSLGVLDPDLALLHAQDAPRVVPQLHDIPGRALDGEILVQRADESLRGLHDHVVVELVRDRPARHQGVYTGSPAALDRSVHQVPLDVGVLAAPSRRIALVQHGHDTVEFLPGKVPVRVGPTKQMVQVVLLKIAVAHLCDDLLGQYVEGLFGDDDPVEFAPPHRIHDRGRLHQFVPRQRKQAALRRTRDRVARAAHALDQRRDGLGRSDLTHEIDGSDIDAQFQGGRGHESLQRARFKPLLGVVPVLFRHAAMVGGDVFGAETVAQVPGQPFRHAPRRDEDQGGIVAEDEFLQAFVDFLPHLVRHDRAEGGARDLDFQLEFPPVPGVEDLAALALLVACAGEEVGDPVDGFLGGRNADARERTGGEPFQALHRKGQMRPPLVADQRVDLVDDERVHVRQDPPPARAREQQVKALRRRHQDVRRVLRHSRPFTRGRVARAYRHADGDVRPAAFLEDRLDALQRDLQVGVDVVAEGLQGGHVDDLRAFRQRAVLALADQVVDGCQKGRQGLARARGRRDQRALPLLDDRPGALLDIGRLVEPVLEPRGHGGMEEVVVHGVDQTGTDL